MCHRLEFLSVELLIQVMKYLPDMAALSKLFTAYPTMIPPFETYRDEIDSSVMYNMSPELRNSALEVLVTRSCSPMHPSHIIKYCLDAKTCYARFRLRTHPLSALLDLIEILGSIESLSQSFARDRILGPCQQRQVSQRASAEFPEFAVMHRGVLSPSNSTIW